MQVKVIIGTIAFMLAMIILGFASLLEPARMEQASGARLGRQIEDGAELFANNCSTCHGINGDAAECFDTAGNQIGCAGLPLNSAALLCGEPSARMVQLNWAGTKFDLIYQTVSAGRVGTLMPTWSQEFGGPMEPHQIEEVTQYVMNWGAPGAELCAEGAEVVTVEWPETFAELPAGSADNGPALYEVTYGCQACHGDPATPGTNLVGPWLGNIANEAGTRVEGQSAEEYLYTAILHPNDFIAPICANDQPCLSPSAMPGDFGQRMSLQDMADIIAFYMTLSTG
jgi:mono/diheme cytochrome c family protein